MCHDLIRLRKASIALAGLKVKMEEPKTIVEIPSEPILEETNELPVNEEESRTEETVVPPYLEKTNDREQEFDDEFKYFTSSNNMHSGNNSPKQDANKPKRQ